VIIECDRCYARYRYDETRFAGKPSKKVRCTKCSEIFEIFNTSAYESLPSAVGDAAEETVLRLEREGYSSAPGRATARRSQPKKPGTELKMPGDLRISLAVIAGPDSGRIYEIEKPRVVIGRSDADINVDDPEVSRQHAAIEISGDKVTLVDLGSTNGTFVNSEAVNELPIENQAEFSVGGSTLMLIVTLKE
jgi:predicted Zn finger-like uncharacterized protein